MTVSNSLSRTVNKTKNSSSYSLWRNLKKSCPIFYLSAAKGNEISVAWKWIATSSPTEARNFSFTLPTSSRLVQRWGFMFHDGPSKSRSVLYGRKCIGSIATFSADVFQYRRYLSSLSIVMADFLLKKKKKDIIIEKSQFTEAPHQRRLLLLYYKASSTGQTISLVRKWDAGDQCCQLDRPRYIYIYTVGCTYIKKKSGFLRLRIGLLLLLMLVKEIHSSTL